MISQKAIDELQQSDGLSWITALKTGQIRSLVEGGHLQLGLFDERNLFELAHPDFPGERLVACRNPELAKLRNHKRQSLIEATVNELDKVRNMVQRGRLKGQAAIGVRVGKVINKYKVAKHFNLDIKNNGFDFQLLEAEVKAEAALDGIYVIRTDLSKKSMSAADTVRNYKRLSEVERAFRSMKTVDLKVRPIHHHLENRVMREAWCPLLFADEDDDAKLTRDPVAPAQRSAAALQKAFSHQLSDGTPVHSFATLLEELATIVRNTCRAPGADDDAPTFEVVTIANPTQRRALELLDAITP
jgi:hypothetical protein